MIETTRVWPLIVAATLILLLSTAATATTAPTSCNKTVLAPPLPPEMGSCHYHAGSIEMHCILMP